MPERRERLPETTEEDGGGREDGRPPTAADWTRGPARLLGTPGPGTRPGGQNAGALTAMEPADPDEAEG